MSRWQAAFLIGCLCLPGCGDGQGSVKGTVALDKQPIAKGAVVFIRDSDGTRVGSVITDGAFQLAAPPGKYRVEINARKVVGKQTDTSFGDKPAEIEITEEMIPERYNKKSELSVEVKAGSNDVNLELQSK